MKILVVSAGIVSDRRPHGEALIAHNILSRLGRRGHDVVAYCTEHDGEIDGVTLRTISAQAPGSAFSRLAFARRAAREAQREHADVHHLLLPLTTDQGYTFVKGRPLVVGPLMLPWPASGKAGEPSSVQPRNRAVSMVVGAAVSRIEERNHAATLARASRLLVTGDPAKHALHQRLHAKCIEVPYGVDTARFTPSPLPEAPTILFFSVMLARKGLATLIDALPLVRARIPGVRLLVAGDDPLGMLPVHRDQAHRMGVANAIRWLGPIAPAEAPALFARSSVFCQPSDGEPFGMTILEAMASGRPIVATNAGGVPGFVNNGEHGRLVAPRDPESLANALIETLASNDDAMRMGTTNRNAAVAHYDWERVVDGIESAYEKAKGAPHVRVAG
ncbi:MAG: glycosyltransferase family 4 protein [Actinomycetota bacterium]